MDADGNAAQKLPDTKGPQVREKRQGSVPERAPADREFLSAAGGRAGCGISRCQRIPQALQPPLRRTNLPDLLRSRRCGTNPALVPARGEPWLAFRASRTVPKATLPNPSDPARDSCLPLPRLLKLAADDAASTNGDAIQPRLQRTALPESANPAKGAQENLLRHVGGVGRIRKNAVNQVVHPGVIIGDQPVERRVRARLQLGHQL